VSFRYYLYTSDSKIDMLLPQIDPAFTRTRTSEVQLNLKMFSARRATSAAGAEGDRSSGAGRASPARSRRPGLSRRARPVLLGRALQDAL